MSLCDISEDFFTFDISSIAYKENWKVSRKEFQFSRVSFFDKENFIDIWHRSGAKTMIAYICIKNCNKNNGRESQTKNCDISPRSSQEWADTMKINWMEFLHKFECKVHKIKPNFHFPIVLLQIIQ